MEEAEQARAAALEAVADIEPDGLRAVIDDHVASSSMLPGVLTILSARVVDGSADEHAVSRRAAGVQLIYEGLRVTRDLVATEPWADTDESDPDDDLDVLAADVLVARGSASSRARKRPATRSRPSGSSGASRLTPRKGGPRPPRPWKPTSSNSRPSLAPRLRAARRRCHCASTSSVSRPTTAPPPLADATDALPEGVEEVMTRVGGPTADDRVSPTSVGDR